MELSTEKRSNIILLREEGYSIRDISGRLNVSIGAIQRTIKRHTETGLVSSKKRSGRPLATTLRTDNLIRRLVAVNPCASSSFIQSQLPPTVRVCTATIRSRLHKKFKLRAFKPAAKPRLSAKNIRDRISFCEAHKDWQLENWSQVLFSDETMIRQFQPHSPYVRRPPNQRFHPRFVKPTVKHCGQIMIWGAISFHGRAAIHFVPRGETVNAKNYIDILKEKLPIWMPLRHCNIFQQDGAPCHQAKVVKDWLRDNHIALLEPWPGSSPDLNPIENCWNLMKQKVSKLNPTSVEDLRAKCLKVWTQEITTEYCQDLIRSMPRRIAAVLKAKGHHSKY